MKIGYCVYDYSLKLKYLKIKKDKKTPSAATIIQLVNDSQFFLSLKIFNLLYTEKVTSWA